MNKKQMNEMIRKQVTKQVSEQLEDIQQKNMITIGIGVLSVGLVSILANCKMKKKHKEQVEEINEILKSIDLDKNSENASTVDACNAAILNKFEQEASVFKDLNETLKKQSEIFDRINFAFDQLEECYEQEDCVDSKEDQSESDKKHVDKMDKSDNTKTVVEEKK